MGRFARCAHALASWCDRHTWLLLAALTAWYIALIWSAAQRPLWFDELYTFYIAQQPTVSRMLEATHTVDLNPPLNYFLTRWSIDLFGATPWATRLPAMFAFWLASVAIFSTLRSRASSLTGILGVLLFWSSAYFSYATEARPYGLLLGFTMLLLTGWDWSVGRRRRLGLITVFFSGVLLLLSHVFGALSLGAIWIAEAARSLKRRKIDWPLVIALIAPLIAMATYPSLFHTAQKTVFPPEAQVSANKLYYLYFGQIRWIFRPLLTVISIGVLWYSRHRKSAAGVNPAFATAMAMLFLIPVALTLLFLRSHGAFYDRYGMAAALPIVLLPPLLLWKWTDGNESAGVVACVCVGCLLLFSTTLREPLDRATASLLPQRAATRVSHILTTSIHGPFRPWWRPLDVPADLLEQRAQAPWVATLNGFHPELTVVAASELTFLEMDHNESPRMVGRLFYLYDRQAELKIAQRTIANGLLRAKQYFPLRAKIVPYTEFIRDHRSFLVAGVYEHPGDWLLRKLLEDGAQVRIIARDTAYGDNDIYLVSFSQSEQNDGEVVASPSAQP